MRQPLPSEEYVTIVDNKGREKTQRVEYVVCDVRGENVYVTADGLTYAEDSLTAKGQHHLIEKLSELANILEHPDIVIWDPAEAPGDGLIYYKQIYIAVIHRYKLVATIVKARRGIKFFYNFHVQDSGRVKGLPIVPPAEIKIWYIAPGVKRREFGL
ncbi:MAG: hypothetical protein NT169_04825 [Chloroflexi bacterium]|nr:hypothetical protein [Chloroflexota bacterium]